MKILKGVGSFVILTPPEVLAAQILLIEKAGRTCYQSEKGPITVETATRFVRMLAKRGHESVLEHSILTVKFIGCSRGFTHEQVRHRITAISQESTRYVDESDFQCVVPPHRDENELMLLEDGRFMSFVQMLTEVERYYRALRKGGWVPEDARQILPTAIKSEIVITANFREWRHIFKMRTQKAAHWEIRALMCDLLEAVRKIVPVIFDDFVQAGVDKNGLRYYELAKPF